MATTTHLTVFQTLHIPYAFVHVLTNSLVALVTAPIRGAETPKSLDRHMRLRIIRDVLGCLYTPQLQYLFGSSEYNYLQYTKSTGRTPQTVHLAAPEIDTKAFWIGDPSDADNVVMYLHGGGFAMPASVAHYSTAAELVASAASKGKKAAVLVLGYDLAPGRKWPRQLVQALEMLRYIVNELGYAPERITLMGDSSGGNLILTLLSHLMQPHPDLEKVVSTPLKLSGPLSAAVLCSPVCILNTDNPRFATNEGQDPATAATIRVWLADYLGGKSIDTWNSPLTADPAWWKGLGSVVQGMLITVATVEMMASDTIRTFENIKSAYDGVELFASEVDFHAEPGIGPALGYKHGETTRAMIKFATERFI